jgi:Protein of unknown function (DUF642)
MLSFLVLVASAFSLCKVQERKCCSDENILANGKFETAERCAGSTWCISADEHKIAPWFITSPNKQYEIDFKGTFSAINQTSMDLNPYTTPVTISQAVKTHYQNKNNYVVKFKVGANLNCGGDVKHGQVQAGKMVQTFSAAGQEVKDMLVDFQATSAWTIVSFKSLHTASGCGPVIFDISVHRKCY